MGKNSLTFCFSVKDYQIVTSKNLSQSDWQLDETAFLSMVDKQDSFMPALTFLPPLKRRRLNPTSRLFFQAAWDLVSDNPNVPVVYASLNSEINRSFELWETLLKSGEVSPTSFSLSVHNAMIGQWSEARKVTQEMTAISAQKDSFELALLEAYLLLSEGHSQVLVAVCESFLENRFPVAIKRLPFDYALCLLIEAGDKFKLTRHTSPILPADQTQLDNAILWVNKMAKGCMDWRSEASNGGCWEWQRN
ncbi:hypothetical protein A6A19_00640 [Actinobacillus delphinicola]|uniref:beta-ketoacyl synthase chain length factor n=1 Tax=Actinobacillus delphinicola TaxID=51161 RepID=UPI002441EF7D|nr:beta-ketoacyl synthase chain length factor [Actinobacillus delphinicola]MDG6896538.1 hypothetical protein [Actinobacillus delphinicola]